jgi:RNA polymerase sigma-70 factor (ECF subfamily)
MCLRGCRRCSTSLLLVFSEGHLAHTGAGLIRTDLATEAHRLTTLLCALAPGEAGPRAMRALQAFHLSRWDNRTDHLLTLDHQDRYRWDRSVIEDGLASLDRARHLAGPANNLLLEAELAACHATARRFEDTDWQRIVAFYDQLHNLDPSPVVELNRAIARRARGRPANRRPARRASRAGPVAPDLGLRADLHRRLNDTRRADLDYQRALDLVGNDIERAYLIHARQQLTHQKG